MTAEKARAEYRKLRRRFTPATGVTRSLAEHVANIQYGDLPASLVARAKVVVLEALGTMVAGARHATSRKLLQYVRRLGGVPEATILYHGDKTHMGNAALANGAFGYGATASVVVLALLGAWIVSRPVAALFGARAGAYLVLRRDLDSVPVDAPVREEAPEKSLEELGIELVRRLRDEFGED